MVSTLGISRSNRRKVFPKVGVLKFLRTSILKNNFQWLLLPIPKVEV